jgi:hypothetical protein
MTGWTSKGPPQANAVPCLFYLMTFSKLCGLYSVKYERVIAIMTLEWSKTAVQVKKLRVKLHPEDGNCNVCRTEVLRNM